MPRTLKSVRAETPKKVDARFERGEQTRAAILEAAFEFLWQHPFRDLTVNALMAPTRVGRSAFYHHFNDVHGLMESLLIKLRDEIVRGAQPWLDGHGDPVALLDVSLRELVRICHLRGPFIKAISDAATTDLRLEQAWESFLDGFDDAIGARIGADQALGLVGPLDARSLAFVLNRMDAYAFIHAFGQHPRRAPEPVLESISRIWIAALYGEQWIESRASHLVRQPMPDVMSPGVAVMPHPAE